MPCALARYAVLHFTLLCQFMLYEVTTFYPCLFLHNLIFACLCVNSSKYIIFFFHIRYRHQRSLIYGSEQTQRRARIHQLRLEEGAKKALDELSKCMYRFQDKFLLAFWALMQTPK